MIISFDYLDLDNFIFQIQFKESSGNTSEEIIMKVTSGKDLKLGKGVSVVFNSGSESDNVEESTEFEEKAESD